MPSSCRCLAARASTAAPLSLPAGTGQRSTTPRPLSFPADFGAHADSRIEWWYVTGALEAGARTWGFQITFFRAATGIAAAPDNRFAARELVFAHAAVSDVDARRLRHDQRIARSGFGIAGAAVDDTDVVLRDWRLKRTASATGASRYRARAASTSAAFGFDLAIDATQPVLLQGAVDGVAGVSRKGPDSAQTSRYYSEPQLAVHGTLALDGRSATVTGRAWLDHEWSDSLLGSGGVGWDWLGIDLDDGSSLMAFRIRRADGSTLWSGGSHRPTGGAVRNFADAEVVLAPGRVWVSPASRARYPVEWRVTTPIGAFALRAAFDDQELDSRASTGAIYWEGLSLLVDASGRRVGRGYLELTGYAAPLAL